MYFKLNMIWYLKEKGRGEAI